MQLWNQNNEFLDFLRSQHTVISHLNTDSIQISQIEELQSNVFKMFFHNSKQTLLLQTYSQNDQGSMAYEFAITSKLHEAKFPVHKPLSICLESTLIGHPFIIKEYIEGRSFNDIKMNGLFPNQKLEILTELLRTLSHLHSINLNFLNSIQIPRAQYKEEIQKITQIYKLNETKIQPHIQDLLYWLPMNISKFNLDAEAQTFCHGNLNINNFLFHPTEFRILSLQNWQHSHFGSPFQDLAQFLQPYYLDPIQQSNAKYMGLPEYQQLINIYIQSRNIPQIPDLRVQTIFSLFQLSANAQQIYKSSLKQSPEVQEQGLQTIALGEEAARVGYQIILSLTDNDPYNIREQAANEAHKWGNLKVSDRCKSYYYRIKEFMKQELFPIEKQIYNQVLNREEATHWTSIKIFEDIQKKARAEGLCNLFISDPIYGKGLTNIEYTFISELMGYSYFGHDLFNCLAPETGNMKLLIGHGTPFQKEKYLKPLLENTCKTFFAMSEKEVASSDPTNFQTTITPVEGGYILKGRKWFVSGLGHQDCKFGIVMGKTSQTGKSMNQQSMILVDLPNEKINILKTTHVLGFDDAPRGYFEVVFNDVFIPAENLLGKEGGAFIMAQGRLVGGRLHHSVRQIGQAARCLDLVLDRADQRVIFKEKLKDMESFQQKIGKLEIKLQSCRFMAMNSAMLMDSLGGKHFQTLKSVSECKAYVPKQTQLIIDEVIQMFGAEGVSDDQMIAQAYRLNRAIRFMDGPCEVHTRQVSRFVFGNHLFNDLRQSEGYGLPKL